MTDKGVPSLVFPVARSDAREQGPLSPSTGFSLFSPRVTEGRLFVQVVSCTGLELQQGYYCVLVVEKQTHTTATVATTEDPTNKGHGIVEWGQMFNFDFTREDAVFHCRVWSRGTRTKPNARDFGEVTFTLAHLEGGIVLSRDFKISDSGIELHLLYSVSPMTKRKLTEDDFQMIKVIGKGSFGTVYQVIKKDTKGIYAMKVLPKKNIIERNAVRHAIAERTVLKNIHHPFLVSLKYAFQTPEHLFMVIDYLNGGELFYHLQQDEAAFGEARAKFYAAEIVLALGYLHDNSILYRDLKPENILLDMEGHVCIVDFGLCKTGVSYNDSTSTFCGSLEYMAPEVLAGEPYSHDIDWWALATMVYEMIEGIPPFWDEETENMVQLISKCDLAGKFDEKFSPECIDFVSQILRLNPSERLGHSSTGTEDIKSHKFFKDIDWVKLYNRAIEPPFKPHVIDEFDLKYFDEEVTAEDPQQEFLNSKKKSATFLNSKQEQDLFGDFSFEEDIVLGNNAKIRRQRVRGQKQKVRPEKKHKHHEPPNKIVPSIAIPVTTAGTTTTLQNSHKIDDSQHFTNLQKSNSKPLHQQISEKNPAADTGSSSGPSSPRTTLPHPHISSRKSSVQNLGQTPSSTHQGSTQQNSTKKSHKKSVSDHVDSVHDVNTKKSLENSHHHQSHQLQPSTYLNSNGISADSQSNNTHTLSHSHYHSNDQVNSSSQSHHIKQHSSPIHFHPHDHHKQLNSVPSAHPSPAPSSAPSPSPSPYSHISMSQATPHRHFLPHPNLHHDHHEENPVEKKHRKNSHGGNFHENNEISSEKKSSRKTSHGVEIHETDRIHKGAKNLMSQSQPIVKRGDEGGEGRVVEKGKEKSGERAGEDGKKQRTPHSPKIVQKSFDHPTTITISSDKSISNKKSPTNTSPNLLDPNFSSGSTSSSSKQRHMRSKSGNDAVDDFHRSNSPRKIQENGMRELLSTSNFEENLKNSKEGDEKKGSESSRTDPPRRHKEPRRMPRKTQSFKEMSPRDKQNCIVS